MIYTIMFTLELAINMFANLFWPFFMSSWSCFDFLVWSTSYDTHVSSSSYDTLSGMVNVGTSSIDMYNNDVGKESAQKFMKQTGDLKALRFG
jgi:hypothetical protein